jgi:hypothetical protein
MSFRSRVKVALFLGILCGSIGWIVCCGGSGSSAPTSSNGPNPTPTPAAHFVTVSWQPSSSPGVTAYNVYRSTVSGGPYSVVGWGVSGPTFTDTAVQPGATYFYVITSLTNANVESTISGEVKATVPSP